MQQTLSFRSVAKMIDHSLLHPTLTDAEIIQGCETAKQVDVATVCVKPYTIELAKSVLSGSHVGICAVVAFPHGNSTIEIKTAEALQAIQLGATEIDVVVTIGKVIL